MNGLQGKIPIKMDDLGVSLFQETSIYPSFQLVGVDFSASLGIQDLSASVRQAPLESLRPRGSFRGSARVGAGADPQLGAVIVMGVPQ